MIRKGASFGRRLTRESYVLLGESGSHAGKEGIHQPVCNPFLFRYASRDYGITTSIHTDKLPIVET